MCVDALDKPVKVGDFITKFDAEIQGDEPVVTQREFIVNKIIPNEKYNFIGLEVLDGLGRIDYITANNIVVH